MKMENYYMVIALTTSPFKASCLALAVGFSSLFSASVYASQTAFTLEHVPKIQHAGNVLLSPNGKITAYTVSKPRDMVAGDEDGRADSHLYIIREDGQPVSFISSKGSVSALQFSADSKTLFFKTKREDDEFTSLYSIPLSGGEAEKRFEFETAIGDYAVSNKSDMLYFVAKPKDTAKDMSKKGFTAFAYEEDARYSALWVVSLNEKDSEAKKLFGGDPSTGYVTSFDMSNNNSTIVAAVAPTNLVDDSLMLQDLVVIDVASGKETSRIDIPGKLGSFELSDNGKQVAFTGGTDLSDPSDGVLMIANTDSTEFTQLTPNALQHIQDVDWYKGDLLTVAHRGVESAMVVYNTKGDEKRVLPTPQDIVVRSADVAGDEIRLLADSSVHPREVFSLKRNKVSKLSDHNSWLSELELAKQTTYTYTARDGEKIEGLLLTPSGSKPAAGWPLILTVHGGPEAHYSDGWITRYSDAGQFGAARGYAVFYPNYRGSTGRGVAFTKQHQGDYAGKEFNDLVDGVKALGDDGLIDRDRVGITGGSYGGYASMWGLQRSLSTLQQQWRLWEFQTRFQNLVLAIFQMK
jgi:dipeptidyl aminopeptidase/acylaminoacyl peptidase